MRGELESRTSRWGNRVEGEKRGELKRMGEIVRYARGNGEEDEEEEG